ncbi:VraH family protein (plasmid) [Staphylococcus agnetis]|uniref:VraH family peptide resistance protein n=2 Tax=Staphylococcus agnetis TaxID=985762 RepID=UPI00117C1467|nr:VraH family protein [Staphylococcus agnetis]TRW80381.1 VraH family protein [Staphylococcus agnetis]
MTIKQIWEELLNKKWDWDDLFWLILMIVIASMFTTPLLGIPIGIGIYFWFFYADEDLDEMAEKYNLKFRNKK